MWIKRSGLGLSELSFVLEKASWRIQSLKTQNIKQGFAARPLETRRTCLGQELGSVDQHDLDRRLGQVANRGPFGVEFGNRLSQQTCYKPNLKPNF